MHGRPRLAPGQAPDAKDQGKAKKLNSLLEAVLRNHHELCYTKEAMKQSAQLLELNPEFYTAWNYRKRAVRRLMDSEPDETARKSLLEDELRLVEVALRANVKSYGAWYHRKWVLEFGYSSLEHEFFLLQKLLKLDSRNFHAWHYRRLCVAANKVTPDKELKFATEKINENFSNYSAWHYRSTLLAQLVNSGLSKEKIIKDEYELVNQAYFTEPDDQSAWFYNTWLLGETKTGAGARLVGTWPSDGSTVRADLDRESSVVQFCSRNPLDSEYHFYSEGLPVILSFSELITDVVLKVSSSPELGHLSNVQWRPLSTVHGPSKVWVSDFPLRGCPEGEYGLSVKISSESGACQETEVHFCLKVSTIDGSNARRKKDQYANFQWPKEFNTESGQLIEERNNALEKEHADSEKDTVSSTAGKTEWQHQLLEEQIQNLRDLLELEPRSKWAKLTLSKVLLEQSAHTHNHGQYTDEVLDLLKELTQLDPDHTALYQSLLSSLFIAKVLRNPNGLKQLWWDPTRITDHEPAVAPWLRWNGLSLSKFDCVQRLLWVQRLDLSNNQLRTIDGLEAMQLLVALDVSNNSISHVTALAPLRLNPQLRYLDISHNEIAFSNVADTSRYSFPSVLTNQIPSCSKERELHQEVVCEDLWEVQVIFGGLQLEALRICGNLAITQSKLFLQALSKALPSLVWLDGVSVKGEDLDKRVQDTCKQTDVRT